MSRPTQYVYVSAATVESRLHFVPDDANVALLWLNDPSKADGTVLAQNYPAGTKRPKGSLITLTVISVDDAWYAFQIHELSEQTPWRPLLWPYKAVVPLTFLLLLVQGVSELIKSFYAARMGIVLEHKEKIEI